MKFGNNIDLAQNQVQNAVMHPLAGAPSSPKPGQFYFNTTNGVGFTWSGTAWRPHDAAALTDGSIPMVALATNPLDRANHSGSQLANTISDLASTVKAYSLDQFAVPVSDVSWNNKKLTSLAAGSAGTDAVNVNQMNIAIQSAIYGVTTYKAAVRLMATGNVYPFGLQDVDNITVNVGDRVALFNQTNGTENAIYIASATMWSVASDWETGEVAQGTQFLVTEGSTKAGTIWRVSNTTAITVGTTVVTLVQTNSVSNYSADNSTITLSSLTFSVKIDPAGWLTSSGSGVAVDKTKVPGKVTGTITHDGSTTSFAVTHSLNSINVMAVVRDSAGNQILVDNQATDANHLTFTWSTAQTNGTQFTYMILG